MCLPFQYSETPWKLNEARPVRSSRISPRIFAIGRVVALSMHSPWPGLSATNNCAGSGRGSRRSSWRPVVVVLLRVALPIYQSFVPNLTHRRAVPSNTKELLRCHIVGILSGLYTTNRLIEISRAAQHVQISLVKQVLTLGQGSRKSKV
jgi:hypothetical protein